MNLRAIGDRYCRRRHVPVPGEGVKEMSLKQIVTWHLDDAHEARFDDRQYTGRFNGTVTID